MSRSLLNFFRDNNLNNEIYLFYNEITVEGGKREISPIFEKNNRYNYYIPLETPINGFKRIVVSQRAEAYISKNKSNLNLNRLRIDFYPWPEIVLASEKYLGYHEERDSVDDVYTRFTFKGEFMYNKLKPQYKEVVFMGFKAITEFIIELPSRFSENLLGCSETEEYDDVIDSDIDESNYNDLEDAFYSGEYLPEDW